MGYTNMGSSKDGLNVGSRNGIDSGVKDPSFVGFRGVEDLGNGLKAGFDLQQRLNPDSGEFYSAGGSARDNILFVQGGFGTVAMGRMTTPQDKLLGAVDPFASANNFVGYGETYTRGAQLLTRGATTRLSNSVAYVSPTFSGLTVTGVYSWNATGDESWNNEAQTATGYDAEAFAISPVYKNGPLTVGFNYHQIKLNSVNAAIDGTKEKVWDLAAAYDFNVVKVGAAYGQDKVEYSGGGSDKVKQWFVGATVPVSAAGAVMASYGETEMDNAAEVEADRWALGYTHALSKRTTAYALYGSLDLGDNAAVLGITGFKGAYERGVGVGLQHRF